MPPRGFPPQQFPPPQWQPGGPPQMLQPIPAAPAGGFAPTQNGLQPGDWRCPQCGNVNFSRREVCHRCNAPKPPQQAAAPPPVVEKEPLVDKFEDDDEAFDAGIAGVIKRPPNANGQRRTKMCMAIQEGRACRFGQACTYAHSTAELELGSRMAPADPNARREDGSLKWQPHLRKTKLCRFFMERGGDCPYGARCNFAHGEDQLESARQPSQDFLQRQGLDISFESRGGFERSIDRSRSDAQEVLGVEEAPAPPFPAAAAAAARRGRRVERRLARGGSLGEEAAPGKMMQPGFWRSPAAATSTFRASMGRHATRRPVDRARPGVELLVDKFEDDDEAFAGGLLHKAPAERQRAKDHRFVHGAYGVEGPNIFRPASTRIVCLRPDPDQGKVRMAGGSAQMTVVAKNPEHLRK